MVIQQTAGSLLLSVVRCLKKFIVRSPWSVVPGTWSPGTWSLVRGPLRKERHSRLLTTEHQAQKKERGVL